MQEQWALYILIFGAVFLAVQGIAGVVSARTEARRTATRFGTIDLFAQNRAEVELLKRKSALSTQHGLLGRFNVLLVQSGSKLTVLHVLVIYVALAAVLVWLGSRFGNLVGLIGGTGLAALIL